MTEKKRHGQKAEAPPPIVVDGVVAERTTAAPPSTAVSPPKTVPLPPRDSPSSSSPGDCRLNKGMVLSSSASSGKVEEAALRKDRQATMAMHRPLLLRPPPRVLPESIVVEYHSRVVAQEDGGAQNSWSSNSSRCCCCVGDEENNDDDDDDSLQGVRKELNILASTACWETEKHQEATKIKMQNVQECPVGAADAGEKTDSHLHSSPKSSSSKGVIEPSGASAAGTTSGEEQQRHLSGRKGSVVGSSRLLLPESSAVLVPESGRISRSSSSTTSHAKRNGGGKNNNDSSDAVIMDSIARFSCHTPRSVLQDLVEKELEVDEQQQQRSFSNGYKRASKRISNTTIKTLYYTDEYDNGSLSSLSEPDDDEMDEPCSQNGRRVEASSVVRKVSSESSPCSVESVLRLPYSKKRTSALLFVDITGFTKLSTLLDVESLSKVINSYFDMIVQEVSQYDGDIIKFAGDAFFAEWRANDMVLENESRTDSLKQTMLDPSASLSSTNSPRSLSDCVWDAAMCASSIVKKFSDHRVVSSKEVPIVFAEDKEPKDAMLNVHCGIGAGVIVGLHVGDLKAEDSDVDCELRREYLILGSPIEQVSLAAEAAVDGQVLASSEVITVLSERCQLPDSICSSKAPVCIASRNRCVLPQITHPIGTEQNNLNRSDASKSAGHTSLRRQWSGLHHSAILRLHRQLLLYTHPVVRGDEIMSSTSHHGSLPSRNASHSRLRAEAELRSVYTMFIKPLLAPQLTGIEETDRGLYKTLQSIMYIVSRELNRFSGHLRQFIVDDKGVVLIGTFGLRGSTFPNMVANSALPATFSIHQALKAELGLDSRIGATFGKVYCGVVGGLRRHEFAVMGAPVNLAARLMYSPMNYGILVDEEVQVQAGARFVFRSLEPVNAKGYDKPVAIVQPLHAVSTNKKRGCPPPFVGRTEEIRKLVDVATTILDEESKSETVMAFVIGESGMGKSVVGLKACDEIRQLCARQKLRVTISKSSSSETEQRIPLSSFRKILLATIKDLCLFDGTLSEGGRGSSKFRCSTSHQRCQPSQQEMLSCAQLPRKNEDRSQSGVLSRTSSRGELSRRGSHRSDSASFCNSIRSIVVPYFHKLCWVCQELGYPYEYADIVGSQLLNIEGAVSATHVDGQAPTVDEVVDFLTAAYLRLSEFSDLVVLFMDDFQWIDSLTWKVVRKLCQSVENIYLICAMRSHDKQALRRMSSVALWHGQMQSRILEVSLGPLELTEVKDLVSNVIGCDSSRVDESLCSDVYNKTGGMPVHAVQLLESMKRSNAVAVDDTGVLRWTAAARREQKRIGPSSVAVIEESFLNRFDSLDRSVREVLQTCAVLGETFSLSDVVRVHPELEATEIEQSLDAAIVELIIVEDLEVEEEDDDDELSLMSDMSASNNSTAILPVWNTIENRFFQFSHAMWRKSVLNKMLKERQIELHRLIAMSIESEDSFSVQSSEISLLLSLFDHWKACSNFIKVAPLALAIGQRLEEWDLFDQSLNLYRGSLEICFGNSAVKQLGEVNRFEKKKSLVESMTPDALDLLLQLHIRLGRGLSLLGFLEDCADVFHDAFTIITEFKLASESSRSHLLPILSGLCSICFERMVYEEAFLAQIKSYIKQFMSEAKAVGAPVHYCRAAAMEASYFARMGHFERAISAADVLLDNYDVQKVSLGMCKEYGKDFAAQCLADCVQWSYVAQDLEKAERFADIVVQRVLPHVSPRDIDTMMEILFPVLMVLKDMGKAAKADSILKGSIINPYRDPLHELSAATTPVSLSLFNPLAYLLEMAEMEERGSFENDVIEDLEAWVMSGENTLFPPDVKQKGNLLTGEICWRLAKRKGREDPSRKMLEEKCKVLLYLIAYDRDDDQSELSTRENARFMIESLHDDDDSCH